MSTIQSVFAQLKQEFPTLRVEPVGDNPLHVSNILHCGTLDTDIIEAMRDRAEVLFKALREEQETANQ